MAANGRRATSISLAGTPYSLDATSGWVLDEVAKLHGRVEALRSQGRLTESTLRAYFGDKRFEQVAESNAIEGSTLDVGETRLAIERGITIAGHDAAYSADAINLSRAIERVEALARTDRPTDLTDVKELHSLILGGGPGAGLFRSQSVRISGAAHIPPSNWAAVMEAMEQWDGWSGANSDGSALLRGIVLHTWLTHVHPFSDGNGRTSRAVLNVELVRGGFPSVIIRRKDRLRYYDALAESDLGGDLEPISELILQRTEDALRHLERVAAAQQGFDQIRAELRRKQQRYVSIWNDAQRLLLSLVTDAIDDMLDGIGSLTTRWYDAELTTEELMALTADDRSASSWLFRIEASAPGVGDGRYLAWTGFRSQEMKAWREIGGGPTILWSVPDPDGYRQWQRDDARSPGVAEMTLELPNVDNWIVRLCDHTIRRMRPSELADRIATAVVSSLGAS
ncbi:Fic family protein [Candidatus Poriferisodalis sp.]|uniref:Fic family protein n=1 Tax=Candidatus Poriferisodalis sp. TaxID=3101277 RepID=UPI003B0144BB